MCKLTPLYSTTCLSFLNMQIGGLLSLVDHLEILFSSLLIFTLTFCFTWLYFYDHIKKVKQNKWKPQAKLTQIIHFILFYFIYLFFLKWTDFFVYLFLRQDLTMQPRLVMNSASTCLSLLRAGITSVHHHTPLNKQNLNSGLVVMLRFFLCFNFFLTRA
jgi:hypothetical protein